MKKKPFRLDRVNDLMQQTLAVILHREVNDPELQKVTLSGVNVSRDLGHAKIYFVVPPESNVEAVMQGFDRAKGFLRAQLAERCGLRIMPELHFHYDKSFREGGHIDALIQKGVNKSAVRSSSLL